MIKLNLVEIYIQEIHSVTGVVTPSVDGIPVEPRVEVDMTVNSYGRIERVTEWFSMSAWEGAKEKGYYWG